MRKEVVEKVTVWDWGLFEAWKLLIKNWLLLQKAFSLDLKARPQMPDAQAYDSTCKHLHSDAVQNYFITYSLSLLSGFLLPASEQRVMVLYTGLQCFIFFALSAVVLHLIYCTPCDSLSKFRIIHVLLSFYMMLIL